ncbi:hypothetical protein G9U52_01795 [Paenibacillus sp. S3N08]|uniref:Uncharacterized protein n=2 Tax=Paenibacillus agricola TaxID=2716264 RepID=A0ABX0IXA2_9BACL|nr:hypothetical protein [Paenibacillus agricola]
MRITKSEISTNFDDGGLIYIHISTDSFKVASLQNYDQAVKIIEAAELSIAQLVGNQVTLIAYEKNENSTNNVQDDKATSELNEP